MGNGIGFSGLLGILFIGLKLGGVIDWSWLWVLAPFWLGPLLVFSIFLFVFLMALAAAALIK